MNNSINADAQITPKALDGRILASENESRVLVELHRFGWLPTRQVSSLLWPQANTPTMAQRTLRRLLDAGEVVQAVAPDGATCYALSAKGARRLREETGTLAKATLIKVCLAG